MASDRGLKITVEVPFLPNQEGAIAKLVVPGWGRRMFHPTSMDMDTSGGEMGRPPFGLLVSDIRLCSAGHKPHRLYGGPPLPMANVMDAFSVRVDAIRWEGLTQQAYGSCEVVFTYNNSDSPYTAIIEFRAKATNG